MSKIKYAVMAVILNSNNEILSVSRKYDHNDMNLPGGKVDKEDANFKEALAREVLEETGLIINTETVELVFVMYRDGFMGYTYFIKDWEGEIYTDEPHIVKWTKYETITKGSFGDFNKLLYKSLDEMGLKIKY